jgi:hypothetical protein
MRVRELIEKLAEADPEAVVLVYPPHADFDDGGQLGDVLLPAQPWIWEIAVWSGERYETFYPGEAEKRDESYSNVETQRVPVVLLGEELQNFRLQKL